MEHPRVSCDKSGQSPVVGTRFKLMGANFDLCAAEFDKLNAAEKTQYFAISMPQASAEEVNGRPGNPELKAAEDLYLESLRKLSAADRDAFLVFAKGVNVTRPDGSLPSEAPPTKTPKHYPS